MPARDLHLLSVAEASVEIAARRLSPVELTQAYLDRIQALGPRVNAYITVTADLAMERARQAEAEIAAGTSRGPLHGIPIALKDLYDTAGIPTTGGSKILAENVPDEDCPAAAKLGEAGAILLGKLNMHEFAFGITNVNPHYGPARNPWNTDCITGGSSGGSGTATAAGLCAASLGSDTGGSIRIPAAFCGIVGLKPTYGRVSKRGVLPLSTSLDTAGPMTRTVADAAIMLQAIAGHDALDPNSVDAPVPNYLDDMAAGIQGLRVGVVRGDYRLRMDDELERAVEATTSALGGLGATLVDPLELPLLQETLRPNFVIISSEAAAYHATYLDERPGDYGEDVFGRLSGGRNNAATDYIVARETQARLRDQLLAAMADFDALALPMLPLAAPPIGQDRVTVGGIEMDLRTGVTWYTQPFNLTGFPAISVPCGFTSAGLPIGFQLVAKPFAESMLLRLAHAYEQSTEWHKRAPAL